MDTQPKQSEVGRTTWRWKGIFVILACLAALYVAYRFVLHHVVDVRIEAIRRAGLPATCAEFDKWYTHVPVGENAADLFIHAQKHYNGWTNALSQPVVITNTTARGTNSYRAVKKADLLPVVGLNDLPPRTEPLPAEMKQLVAEYLADNAEALRFLHQVALMKRCRFPVDWSKGFNAASMTHLIQLRQGERLLQLEAIACVEDQKPDQATESVIAALGFARTLNQEPIFISRLVAIACHGISIGSLQHVLNRTSLSDEQLVKLAAAFSEKEDPQGLMRTFIGERCFGINRFDQIRSGKVAIENMFWFDKMPPWFVLALYKPAGLLDLDELVYLNLMPDFIKAAQLSPPQSVAATKALTVKATQLPFYAVLSHSALGVLDGVVTHDVRGVAQVQTAVASLAIERYRLAKGDLPEKLGDLVPAYLDAIPRDPFDNKPLRYKKLARGYVVYSIGEDGEDNGGEEECHKDIIFIVER